MKYQCLLLTIMMLTNFSESTTTPTTPTTPTTSTTPTSSTETTQSENYISSSYEPIRYERKEDWLKIQNWELAKENRINDTLYNFLGDEELSDCFMFHRSPTIIKFRCYSKHNIEYITTLFCIRLTDGFMCI